MRFVLVFVALAVLLATGCKSPSRVAMRMILPPGAEVMDMPEDKAFLMASPVSQPMPTFPVGAPRRTRVSACVEMVIDESGAVRSASPLYGLPDCPLEAHEMDRRFVASSIAAARKWQFLAAAICTFPPGTPPNDECTGAGVVISEVAIKVSYVFSFEGDGRVSARAKRG
jgi:hypothetical protein